MSHQPIANIDFIVNLYQLLPLGAHRQAMVYTQVFFQKGPFLK
jgi:hypothetical protein